jgi:DNA polymerase-3 subunit beta
MLQLTAFDLSDGIQLDCQADVLESGSICVPARSFNAIAKGMAGQLVIEVVNELMTISDLSGSCEIQCQLTDEYPSIIQDEVDLTTEHQIDIKTFVQAIKMGASCASSDPSRMILQGVNIVAKDGLLTMASTDGHRLVIYKTEIDKSVEISSATVPIKLLSGIAGNGIMSLAINPTACIVGTANMITTCRVFDGKYPDYPMLLPKSFTRTATIDRIDLIDALALMSVIGNTDDLVRFMFEDNELLIRCEREGLKGERKIECEMKGSDFECYEELEGQLFVIAFNLKYLLGHLKNIPSKQVKISMNSATEPVVIKPVDSKLDLLCLVMPTVIRS